MRGRSQWKQRTRPSWTTVFCITYRLLCSWFLDLGGNLGNVKEKPIRKTSFFHKRSAWFHASTFQSFTRQHFLEVKKISIVSSWEIGVKMRDNIWKLKCNTAIHLVAGNIVRSHQVWGSRNWIKFTDEKQYSACWEIQ